jgi:hypothetical protein
VEWKKSPFLDKVIDETHAKELWAWCDDIEFPISPCHPELSQKIDITK